MLYLVIDFAGFVVVAVAKSFFLFLSFDLFCSSRWTKQKKNIHYMSTYKFESTKYDACFSLIRSSYFVLFCLLYVYVCLFVFFYYFAQKSIIVFIWNFHQIFTFSSDFSSFSCLLTCLFSRTEIKKNWKEFFSSSILNEVWLLIQFGFISFRFI